MKNLSVLTRVYILGVVALGTAITVGVFFLPAGLRLDLPFFIFLALAVLVQLFGVRVVLPGQERHAYSLLTAVLVAAILLFPPANSILLCIVTFLAYWFQRRRTNYEWYQGLFNIAQYLISVAAAEVVWQLGGVSNPAGGHRIQWYAAGFGAGFVFYVINGLLVTGVISLAANRPFRKVRMINKLSLSREMVLIWVGVMGADFWLDSPLLAALLIIFLGSLSTMLRVQGEAVEDLRARTDEAEERAKELASLNELARALTGSFSRSQIYDALNEQIQKSVKPSVFATGLLDAKGEQVAFGMWRAGERQLAPFIRQASEPILQRLLTSTGPVVLEAARDGRAIAELLPPDMPAPDATVIGLPMTVRARTIGVIILGTSNPVSPQQRDLFSTMASQAAVALEKAELFENLQTQMVALEQAQLQLLQSAKLATIGELAAFVAHEINNPLTSVLGYASLIMSETDTSDTRRADLEVIEKEALRARAIVRDLLSYARQTDSVMGPTYINAALEAVLPLIRQRAEGQHVQIATRFEPHLPTIMGDANQLKQVFINLLNNAIDAMPDGGEIQIETRAVSGNGTGPQVEIAFQDTGIGIQPDQLPKIFDPFFTTKKAGQGTGLGLPISKRIVERHGGAIGVSSAPGTGTRFTITLPVAPS